MSLLFQNATSYQVAVERPIVIMCPPTYFDTEVTPWSNDWTVEGRPIVESHVLEVRERALRQYAALKAKYAEIGVMVLEMTPREGLIDQVFATDSSKHYRHYRWDGRDGLVYDHAVTVFAGNYTNRPRQDEEVEKRKFLEGVLPESEGHCWRTVTRKLEFGDTRYDPARGWIWGGYGIRSTQAGQAQLSRLAEIPHQPVELYRAPKGSGAKTYYHCDTTLLQTWRGHIASYEGGFTRQGYQRFLEAAFDRDPRFSRKEHHIPASAEDAAHFALNGIAIKDDIILPPVSREFRRRLEDAGYRVHELEVDALIPAGGGHSCMSDVVTHHVPGGWVPGQQARAR